MKKLTHKQMDESTYKRHKEFETLLKPIMKKKLTGYEYYGTLGKMWRRLMDDCLKGDNIACNELTLVNKYLTSEDREGILMMNMFGFCMKAMLEHPEILESATKKK